MRVPFRLAVLSLPSDFHLDDHMPTKSSIFTLIKRPDLTTSDFYISLNTNIVRESLVLFIMNVSNVTMMA